jgi:hypothetical protein
MRNRQSRNAIKITNDFTQAPVVIPGGGVSSFQNAFRIASPADSITRISRRKVASLDDFKMKYFGSSTLQTAEDGTLPPAGSPIAELELAVQTELYSTQGRL